MTSISSHNPHPPMYPMYPTEAPKSVKPKPKKNEDRVCLCFPKRRRKSATDIVRGRVEGSRLEFWFLYAVPYALVIQGVICSIIGPILGLVYMNECPALPVLVPVLLGRFLLAFVDALGMFLMTAEAFNLGRSYPWINKISEKVSWRLVAGWLLALFIVWGTILFTATNDRYTGGNPVSYDPKSPYYCHKVLYRFANITEMAILIFLCSSVVTFLFGSILLLVLLCIIARIGS